ncbi:histamine H2 receptor-like [Dendronephthya gigantea]|uniref:histamine H2 receptor-like n=1 Tax=Dendronephthya gigantea TaxID=151771 RepID=UPI00106B6B17|nr:histamine H2 receptor-like [Dendronephthya gigantea]
MGRHGVSELNTVLLVVLMLFTLFGNFVLLLAIWRNKRLRKVTHLHSISLIVANFIPATTIIPLRIARIWNENEEVLSEETTLCEAYLTSTLLWCVASILTLVSVSFDRYIAISKPGKYRAKLTHNKTLLILLAVWCFAIFVAFMSLYHTGSGLKLFTCNFNILRKESYVYLLLTVEVIPLILMFVLHFQITKLSAKHAQSIGIVDSRFTEYNRVPLDFPAEVRWSRVVILVILLYVLMWSPRCIYLIIDDSAMTVNSARAFDVLTEVITYSFAGLAPLVLVHFNNDMREEFFRILMPFQWFKRSHGVGKKYNNTNIVTPFEMMT